MIAEKHQIFRWVQWPSLGMTGDVRSYFKVVDKNNV